MSNPLVHCTGCARAWHSPTMADGLRVVGCCPRCGGVLVFTEATPVPIAVEPGPAQTPTADVLAPHLVLGVPRR